MNSKKQLSLSSECLRHRLLALAALLLVVVLALAGCAQTESPSPKNTTGQGGGTGTSASSILTYRANDEKSQKLVSDMEAGLTPVSCDVLYDRGGAAPTVLVTDEATIKELYTRFSKMTVLGSTKESITDCYHHVKFTLQDGTIVGFYFEGDIWFYGSPESRSKVEDNAGFWSLVRTLQEEKDMQKS